MTKRAVLFVVALVVGAFLAGPAWAKIEFNVKEPFEASLFVPCANDGDGEVVLFTGFIHQKVTFTENGKTYSFTSSAQPMGVSGVGEVTGDTYRLTGGSRAIDTGAVTGYPFRSTYVHNYCLIGPGPGNNSVVHETWHITVNANGQVTAEVENVKVDCK